jgi:hypothetical protein
MNGKTKIVYGIKLFQSRIRQKLRNQAFYIKRTLSTIRRHNWSRLLLNKAKGLTEEFQEKIGGEVCRVFELNCPIKLKRNNFTKKSKKRSV